MARAISIRITVPIRSPAFCVRYLFLPPRHFWVACISRPLRITLPATLRCRCCYTIAPDRNVTALHALPTAAPRPYFAFRTFALRFLLHLCYGTFFCRSFHNCLKACAAHSLRHLYSSFMLRIYHLTSARALSFMSRCRARSLRTVYCRLPPRTTAVLALRRAFQRRGLARTRSRAHLAPRLCALPLLRAHGRCCALSSAVAPPISMSHVFRLRRLPSSLAGGQGCFHAALSLLLLLLYGMVAKPPPHASAALTARLFCNNV